MKKLFIILLFLCGCYEAPEVVEGHYYIQSDIPVVINYTTPEGEKTIYSDNLNVYFEIEKEKYSDYFDYKIEIISETKQNIYLLIEFDNVVEYEFQFFTDYIIETLSYCPSWNDKCAKVTIGFK